MLIPNGLRDLVTSTVEKQQKPQTHPLATNWKTELHPKLDWIYVSPRHGADAQHIYREIYIYIYIYMQTIHTICVGTTARNELANSQTPL